MDPWSPSTDVGTGPRRRAARSTNRPRLQSIGSESSRSVRSRAESETDLDEILSPQPRHHPKLLNAQLLQSQARPLSPLNPNTRGRTTSFALTASTLHGQPHESFARRFVRWFARNGLREWTAPVIIAGAILVRCAVGLGGYSGENTKPMHGDYEAQRHWMEITYHLRLREWYSYDLQYWGLDYPPLTAYVSWLCGFIAHKINPAWVALDASRGYESPESKHFMRMSVLILEMVVYIPAVYVYTRIALPGRSRRTQNIALLTVSLQPALILIDHGHFQYNSVMLGLTLWAVNMFYLGHDLIGAVCFVASLCFKQMGLYYAPAIGSYLLGKCFWLGKDHGTRHFAYLAFTTSLSFFLLFLPFMTPALLPEVIFRVFPFARGLFEDKVANFWCASDVVLIKWKRLQWISQASLQRVALFVTLLGTLPGAAMVFGWGFIGAGDKDPNKSDAIRHRRGPTLPLLSFALFSCAMSFFMFSVQVHEKSILLPLMPVTLLLAARESESEVDSNGEGLGGIWEWGVLVNNVAVFSMWPLLKRDGQGLNYVVLTLLWNYVIGYDPSELPNSLVKILSLGAYATLTLIHILEAIFPAPARYPDLFPVLNVLLSASVFGVAWIAVGGIMLFRSAWATGGFDISPQEAESTNSFEPILKSPKLPQSPLSEGSVRRRKGLQGEVGSRVIENGLLADAS
ncbi:Glucosyltransferase-like protein [Ceratobasidium sp. 394]|nr:Glucosyltransferase-like protein [Ceratobasidium sp. 394]